MPRLPYAAAQLIKQVGEERPSAEYTEGAPDGLDVIRDITFDKPTSKWLWDRMKGDLDPRIASGVMERNVLTLTFQGTSPLADDPAPFDLSLPAKAEAGVPVDLGSEDDGAQADATDDPTA